MGFWDWLFKPKVDIQVADLQFKLAQEKDENAGLMSQLSLCLDEKSRGAFMISQLQQQNSDLQVSLQERDLQIDSLQKQIIGYASQVDDLINQVSTSQSLIDNLTKQRNILEGMNFGLKGQIIELQKSLEITPETLQAFLIAKYPQGTDVSKIWDTYDLALINAFAVTQDDDPMIISQNEFKGQLISCFPHAIFHSPGKDNEYFACTVDMAEKIIRNDFGNLVIYDPNRRDCDKFTQLLRAHFYQVYGYNNVVEIWGMASFGYHSWAVIVCSDGLLQVEPQTDQIVKFPDTLGYEVQAVHDW